MVLKIRFRFFTEFRTNSQKTSVQGERFWRISRFAWLSQKKWFGVRQTSFTLSLLPTLNRTEDSIQDFGRFQNEFIGNSSMERNFLESFKACLAFQKNGFVFVEQIQHFEALYQYSITQKIRITLLADFKTSLQKTPI